MNKKTAKILGTILGAILSWLIIWAFTVGVVKLITMCFSLPFSFATGTGVFFVLFLLSMFTSIVIRKRV